MDEAFMMTRGKYRELHGNANVGEVFLEHAKKVVQICEKYGLRAEAWGDMFVEHDIRPPKGLGLRAWAYSMTEKEGYMKMLDDTLACCKDVSFATAIHKWYGYAPLNEYSLLIGNAAIEASIGKIQDVAVTLWGDDGGECSLDCVWYGLLSLANTAYGRCFDKKGLDKLSELLTGYTMYELSCMDLPNKVFDAEMKKPVNVSKYVLFEDIFYGIADRADNRAYTPYFVKNAKILRKIAQKQGDFQLHFQLLTTLCEALAIKNDLRRDCIESYRRKDVAFLQMLVKRLTKLIEQLKVLKDREESLFLAENKPFGLAIQSIRLSGLIARLIQTPKWSHTFI